MIVVPLSKDVILTKDGGQYKVVEYTNYKEAGPAVYVMPDGKEAAELSLVYFFDIEKINGTRVEYLRGRKVFHALGKLKRTFQLPQPDDKVTVAGPDSTEITLDVEGLKLKSKSLGINKGMFVQDSNGEYHRMKKILNIDPALGEGSFDQAAFLKYYKDYIGV